MASGPVLSAPLASLHVRHCTPLLHLCLVLRSDTLEPVGGRVRDVASGIMVTMLSREMSEYVIWFKREQLQTITWAGNHHITRIYSDAGEYGYLYFVLSIVLMIVIQDTYFYWTHRLLHWRPMFKYVHKLHHLSVTPTPFSAYAFHPVEAFINVLILPAIVFIIPYHNNALTIFTICSLLFNIKGHMGYEFVPEKWRNYFAFKWLNSTTQHDKHHSLSNYNYGFYFAFWDAVMKTVHKEEEIIPTEHKPVPAISNVRVQHNRYHEEEIAECA
ncbi:MAG: hypothetical protein EOP51_16525 [Sphingobacteriales bacterium]|nr:MAG: hypothetical protein EOP51_16525 [Sphingobacteriales bacterium]